MAKRARTSSVPAKPFVVAIGASAGGITALQTLFSGLSKRPNFAVVVIQHLSPGKPSALAGLIRRWCSLTVHEARAGVRLKRGNIYVACPDDVLTLEQGAFRTRSLVEGRRRPGIDTIDAFFESLALDCGARALAVVLSGTGTDGAGGALCIKRAKGLVIVQDPLTATHDSMPRAAISYGTADYILPLSGIAEQLRLCTAHSYQRPTTTVSQTAEVTRALDAIVGLMREQAGVDLSGYKPTPLLWRIQRRMDARRARSLEDYESLLRDDSSELEALVRGIPIHVTEFFRDPPAWQVLNDDVIDPLSIDRRSGDPIRAWTPACATGEEAYSVAMLLSERARSFAQDFDFQVFATDASAEIIARASRGAFRTEALSRFPPQRKARFFYEADAVCRVKRNLRDKMVFATQDLLTDPPFTNLDLVTCRNLLIYLDREAAAHVLYALHSSLRVGGYLFLGRGEDLPPRQQGFKTVSARWHIYRKEGPVANAPFRFRSVLKKARARAAAPVDPRRIAMEHDFPSVLIDGDFQILRIYGDTESILRFPAGQPTFNLLQLAQPVLGEQLRGAVTEAQKIRRPVIVSGLRALGKGEHTMSVRLTPLQTAGRDDTARLLVSFIPERDAALDSRGDDSGRPSTREWREAVRISSEELDASREELQALNEELNASNEQLSVANEGLSQANSQLQEKIAELEMQSRVLSSGEVATLFLDQDLRVRWFTPATSELFPLRPMDAGRRITDLIPRFADENFLADIQEVMKTGETREAEVRNLEGRWFMRRILPYLGDRNVSGVAITFADISVQRSAEGELRRSEASFAAQKEAFQAAVNGAPLSASLDVLVRAAINQMGEGVRCAFYLADGAGRELHHIAGMPEEYRICIDGFEIGPDSPACGLAMHTGRPVITPDVAREPRWKEWLPLSTGFSFRACWSFPVETTAAKVIGTFAVYHPAPRDATARDLEFAGLLTRAAAVIISRYQEAEKRAEAEVALRESRAELTRELEVARARLEATR